MTFKRWIVVTLILAAVLGVYYWRDLLHLFIQWALV